MNILFLLKSFDLGGVEVVTSVLANKFVSEGFNVVIWAFYKHEPTLEDRLHPNVKVVYGDGFAASTNNVNSLVDTLEKNLVDVVINQWALPPQSTSLLKKAIRKYPVKIISVHHSDPKTNGRLMSIDMSLRSVTNPLEKLLLQGKRKLYKIVTSCSMRRCYKMSDLFVVLSESYKKHLSDFIGVKNMDRLVAIANPVTIDKSAISYDEKAKEKRILYVGRLECSNKKPGRVLNIWKSISRDFEDWYLDIVGDGPEREELENMASYYGLERVIFYGNQQPGPFYQAASVLLLTSDFEGFPLVIAEAMSFGVVPVVYGSFSAVNDIIDDGINGFIVHKTNGLFNHDAMVEKVELLIRNVSLLENMSLAAIEKSKKFSKNHIYGQWMKVMNKLK